MGECERGRLDELESAGVGENKSVGMRLWRVGELENGCMGKWESATVRGREHGARVRVREWRVREWESARVCECEGV